MFDSIYYCQDLKVCADVLAISYVGRGMIPDFDNAASFLILMNPVTKKVNKRKKFVISEVTGTQSGVGTSGVILCWTSNEEYGTLNSEHKSEIHNWRIKNGTNWGGPKFHKGKNNQEC